MDSRRKFIGEVATGLAGTLVASSARALGANERIRIGIIGTGDRGLELINHIRACPNAEIGAVADIYSKRLDTAAAGIPGASAFRDNRKLLEDRTIDAVVIATPQHLHAEHFRDAIAAGKHVYLEKTAAFTVADAKNMRAAYRQDAGRHVVQIGHQACSTGHAADVRQFLSQPNRVG